MNKFNSRKPRYNDDSDYTTNAPSYYDDLARKNQLIKHLAKRIWEYDKILADSLEEIEEVLNEVINKIGEGFNEEIYNLLIKWVEDGTLDHIINETLMNKKADITYVDDLINGLTNYINEELLLVKNDILKIDDDLQKLKYGGYIISSNPPEGLEPLLGDGSDETIIMENLLMYCKEHGKSLFISSGEYHLQNFEVPPFVGIKGEGRENVTLRPIGFGTFIKINQRSDLSDFTIRGTNLTNVFIDKSGANNTVTTRLNIFGDGVGDGIVIKDGDVESSYYMTEYDIHFMNLTRGVVYGISGNSNRLMNCRFGNVEIGVDFTEDNPNNNMIFSCTFENFKRGIRLNGRNNVIIGCRFENPQNTVGQGLVGIEKMGGYGNWIYSCFFSKVDNRFIDGGENQDTIFIDVGINMGNRSINNLLGINGVEGITMKPIENTTGGEGKVAYFKRDTLPTGLYFYSTTWRKLQEARSASNINLFPSNPAIGEMIFALNRNKPYWWNGNNWVDSTGNEY